MYDTKKCLFEGENWMKLDRDRFHWRAGLDTAMNLLGSNKAVKFIDQLRNSQFFNGYSFEWSNFAIPICLLSYGKSVYKSSYCSGLLLSNN